MYKLYFHSYKRENGHFYASDEVRHDVSLFAGAPCTVYADAHGKPLCDGAYLSISHTGDIAAVAVSDREIGIDIERLDRALPPKMRDCTIWDWTDAEAAAKLCGVPPLRLLKNIPENVLISHFVKYGLAVSLAEYKE